MHGKILYLSLLSMLFYPGLAEGRATLVGWYASAQSSFEPSSEEPNQLEYGSEQWHQEKKKLDAMLWASIVIVTVLFTGIVMLTLIRIGRRYRKRVTGEKKPEPTEYVDAWSQYRLPEDEDSNGTKES